MNAMDHLSRAALSAVLNSVGVSVGLTMAAWALARLLPRTNAATRHLLWWGVLAMLVLLPFRGTDRRQAPMATRDVVAAPVEAAPVTLTPSLPRAAATFPLRLPAGAWPRAVLLVWALFCLVHLGRITWSFRHLRAVKRRSLEAPEALRDIFQAWVSASGVRRPVRLLVSAQIASPMATGFLSPAVILPQPLLTEFRDRELDHVLLHELAHVARRDDWSNLVARALNALVGLHPVAAWVLRQVERETELACDDWVVSMTGEARPYAASLARLFEVCGSRRRLLLAAGMAGTGSHLGQRIETLLDRGRQFTARVSLARVAVAAAALLLLVGAGSRTPRWIVLAQSAPASAPRPQFVGPSAPVKTHGSFLAALVAAGYGNLPVEEIIALKDRGVTAAFLDGISQSGWSRMTPGELMELQSNGVSPGYLAQVRAAGFQGPSIRDVIAMHARGVRPEAIAQIHGLGFGPYTPGQAIELCSRGVPPEFFGALRDAGFTRVEPNEAIDAYTRGVRSGTLRAAGQYGSHLTLRQIVRLKESGVVQ
jgi:beta-lactamase regulating signal transducer with metallopeptidase domain